jgi:hypothetical protein
MKTPSKLVIGVTTAAAIVAPFAPKTVNINIGDPPAIVSEVKTCTLISTVIDDRGKKFCEYRCGTQLRIMPETAGSCEKSINEKLIK